METTICFLNDRIIAMSGTLTKNHVHVQNFKVFELSEGSIINGVITNSSSVKSVLKQIKDDASIFSKSISLIINSSLVYIKQATIPNASKSQIITFVKNEFIGIDSNNTEMLFDYSLIKDEKHKEKTNSSSIVCYAVEKNMIKGIIELFEEEEITLSSINVSTNCLIKLASAVPSLENKTYAIANVDKNNITLVLFVNNKYYYSTRARLIHDFETEEFFQEISTQLSALNQFNKSQKNGGDISEVFLCGLSQEQSELCSQYISDLGIKNSSTDIFSSVATCLNYRLEMNASDFIFNIGAFFRK